MYRKGGLKLVFKNEQSFEDALVNLLISQKGWDEVLDNPTEEDLIQNWADILFQNNKEKDRLNNVPLNRSEMNQIIEQINGLQTPLKRNEFINGKSVSIKRENEEDTLHFGKEVSLKIYDRQEIAAGKIKCPYLIGPVLEHFKRRCFLTIWI